MGWRSSHGGEDAGPPGLPDAGASRRVEGDERHAGGPAPGAPTRAPLVAVVVVNWGRWRDTLRCLGALDALDYRPVATVVVDNGSPDDSVAQLRRARPSLHLIPNARNEGFAAGSNLGIRWGRDRGAEYVWLLNNDAEPEPRALSALVAAAEADPGLGAVGSVLHEGGRSDRVQNWGGGHVRFRLGLLRPCRGRPSRAPLDYLSGASLLLRSRAVAEVGLLDERYFMYWEDVDLALRLRRAGWRLGVAADAIVWHGGAASLGANSPEYHAHFNASAVRFFRKHAAVPALPILAGVGCRALRRLVRGEWRQARAAWGAVRGGPPGPAPGASRAAATRLRA
jgi:hypothetical protein